MKNHANEPEKDSSGFPWVSVWKRAKDISGKIFFTLIILVFLSVIILSVKAAFDKADQKVSEELRNNLIKKGSMENTVLLPEMQDPAPENSELSNTPENEMNISNENSQSVVTEENNENKPEEKVVESNLSVTPVVKKEPVKKTVPSKLPAVPVKKKESKEISCKHKNDHPSRSKTKGKHMDEDCCPDPDEWPKPGCVYSEKGLAIMLSGPPKKKK